MCSISQLFLVFRLVISSSQGPLRLLGGFKKAKKRDETAKKHRRANERKKRPRLPLASFRSPIFDFFTPFLPTAEPGPRLFLIRSQCFCYFLFRVESMC